MSTMHASLNASVIGDFGAFLVKRGDSPATQRARTYWIARILRETHRTPDTLTEDDISQWLGEHHYRPATVRMVIMSIQQFYEWALAKGVTENDPAQDFRVPRQTRYSSHPIPKDVLIDSMARCTIPYHYWILRILSTTGLRRSELANLRREHLVDGWLEIEGKGNVQRRVPVPEDVEGYIRQQKGYVFRAWNGGKLNHDVITQIVRKETGGFTPHSLRHYYASIIYRRTHDLRAVQELLGHKSIATTERYIGIDDDAIKLAAQSAWAA